MLEQLTGGAARLIGGVECTSRVASMAAALDGVELSWFAQHVPRFGETRATTGELFERGR